MRWLPYILHRLLHVVCKRQTITAPLHQDSSRQILSANCVAVPTHSMTAFESFKIPGQRLKYICAHFGQRTIQTLK